MTPPLFFFSSSSFSLLHPSLPRHHSWFIPFIDTNNSSPFTLFGVNRHDMIPVVSLDAGSTTKRLSVLCTFCIPWSSSCSTSLFLSLIWFTCRYVSHSSLNIQKEEEKTLTSNKPNHAQQDGTDVMWYDMMQLRDIEWNEWKGVDTFIEAEKKKYHSINMKPERISLSLLSFFLAIIVINIF